MAQEGPGKEGKAAARAKEAMAAAAVVRVAGPVVVTRGKEGQPRKTHLAVASSSESLAGPEGSPRSSREDDDSRSAPL